MYGSFERPPASVRLLRFLSLLVLAFQACLLLRDLVSWPRMLGLLLLTTLAGTVAGRARLRPWVRVSAAAASPFLLRLAAFSVFRLAGLFSPGPASDALFPAFDETFFPLLPLWWWAFGTADLAERVPRFGPLEAGLNLAFLAALFWTQGDYRVTLYPHPSVLAAVAGGQLFLSLAVLAARIPRSSRRSAGRALRLGGFFLVLTLFLLTVLGRYSEAASARGGGLLRPTLFRFDLSRYLRLETEISLSDELVLIVRKDPLDANVFLRRFVLAEYDGRGMFRPSAKARTSPESVPSGRTEWDVPPWSGRSRLDQEYWILSLDPRALLAIDAPVSITPYRLEAGSSFSSAYSLTSSAPVAALPLFLEEFDPREVPAGFDLSAAERDEYTRWGNDPRVLDLAKTAAAAAGTYYEKVTAVLSHLRENYFYSLKPGAASDGNQLAHFLFEGKKGYCSYFAFSMTLLLRSLGIPARVAAGFFVDSDAAVLEFHPVRADMAHAWTEVWFGQYGWVAFDPTSRVPAPGERFEESRGVDPAVLEKLLREILRGLPEASGGTEETDFGERPAGERIKAAVLWALKRAWFLLPALYVFLVVSARFVRVAKIRGLGPDRRKALVAWDSLEETLAAAGTRRPRGESVPDFADRLDRERSGVPGFGYGVPARALEGILFAPAVTGEEVRSLVESLDRLRAAVNRRTSPIRKALAFLDIRAAVRPLPGGRKK